jgi:hypothetical protein
MRNIDKTTPPQVFVQFNKKPSVNFEILGFKYPWIKHGLRLALAKEQGYLCAYCMSGIDYDLKDSNNDYIVRIEHWLCQSLNPPITIRL